MTIADGVQSKERCEWNGDDRLISPAEERISLIQLFILIILFQMGSAAVVGIGLDAGRDAWIAVLFATSFGVGLFRIYAYIPTLQPGMNLYETIEALIGRKASVILIWLYTIYFLYIAARVLRDFIELLITSTFPNTPMEMLTILFMLAIIYTIYLGPEVFARTSEIFFPYIVLFITVIGLLLLAGGDIHLENMQPVLADGMMPVMEAVFPTMIGFPFGETFVFTVFLASVQNSQKVPKVGMLAVLLSGFLLTYMTIIILSVIGVDMAERSMFPLLNTVREIALFDFIERLDALAVFTMMIGIHIKVTMFFFGGLKGLEYVFRIPYRSFTFPIGTIVTFFTIMIASNFAEHIQEGIELVPLYLHIPFLVIIPFLLAFTIWIKKRKGGSQLHV